MSNLGYNCEGRVGNTVISETRFDATIDEAWEKFADKLEELALMVLEDPEDWEVIRVATKVHHNANP